MAEGQTSYGLYSDAAIAGMIADLRMATIESHVADVAITFGQVVVDGAVTGKSVKVPTATGQAVRGIATHKHTEQAYPFTTPSGTYAINDMVSVLRRGLIWCVAAAACTLDGPVYIDVAGGTFKLTDTTGSNLLVPSAVFRSTVTTLNDLVLVEINLPV